MAASDAHPKFEPRSPLSELLTTIVLALASILTAWSVFQSAKWSGRQELALGTAAAARADSNKAATLAGQEATIDIFMFVEWVQAIARDPAGQGLSAKGYTPIPHTASAFFYNRFRAEFKPALKAWLATQPIHNPDAPSSPFVMKQYSLASSKIAERLAQTGEDQARRARDCNRYSDQYVGTTVFFAVVLFFAAVGNGLRHKLPRRIMLGLAIVLLAVAGGVLATFPVA